MTGVTGIDMAHVMVCALLCGKGALRCVDILRLDGSRSPLQAAKRPFNIRLHAGVAQLVEQRTRNAQVSSSSLDTGSRVVKGPRKKRGPFFLTRNF